MPRTAKQKKEPIPKELLQCPVCMSDRMDDISQRMKKCLSCGFIWNHEVSDRDNLLLIVEHQSKFEKEQQTVEPATPKLKVVRPTKTRKSAPRRRKA